MPLLGLVVALLGAVPPSDAAPRTAREGSIVSIAPTGREEVEMRRAARKLGVKLEAFGHRESSQVDANGIIAEAVRRYARNKRISGVIGTDDLGSLMASVVNDRLGLPGASTRSVFRSQHKFLSREHQRLAVATEHLPRFKLVPLDAIAAPPGMSYPFFLKPVKASLSRMARQIDDETQLRAALAEARTPLRAIAAPFEDIRLVHTEIPVSTEYMIAEELIRGDQVTVEGFVHRGKANVLGIVDSVMYPGTRSFRRFDYPSRHAPAVQRKMQRIAAAIAEELGLENTIFNVEMAHDPQTGEIKVIEINPRPSSQFASLFEAVDGTNTYEVQLRLAAGRTPHFRRHRGRFTMATSFVMRTFQDQVVVRSPDDVRIRDILRRNPDMRIETFGKPGGRLSEAPNDPESFRWAIVTLGGKSEDQLQDRLQETLQQLDIELKPTEP